MSQNARSKMSWRAGMRGNAAQANALNGATSQTGHSTFQQALRKNISNQNPSNQNNSTVNNNLKIIDNGKLNINNVGTKTNINGDKVSDKDLKIGQAKAATKNFESSKKTGLGGSILGAL